MTNNQMTKKHLAIHDKLDSVLSKDYQMLLNELLELEHELSLNENK